MNMSIEHGLLGICIFINLLAFFLLASDKHKAVSGQSSDRVPEGMIFFMAAICGALGVYAGMILLRHKTKKWYFTLGIPLLIMQNLATLYLVKQLLLTQV